MRYGFNGTVCTLDQTGERLEFTGARTRELERQSLRKLRSSRWGRLKHLENRQEQESRNFCHHKVASKESQSYESGISIWDIIKKSDEEFKKRIERMKKLIAQYGIDGCEKYFEEEKRKTKLA